MHDHYDVVVVGAGPAGLMAARALAGNGFRVAIAERRSDPRVIARTCGQSLLPPNEYFFGDIFHYNAVDRRFCFTCAGLSFPYAGPVRELHTWHMYSPGMNALQFGTGTPGSAPIALSYDKETMLAGLLDEIACDHVELITGAECTGLQPGPGCVVVQAGERQLQATCVIAADGANSRVVDLLGYNVDRRYIADLYVKSAFVEGFNSPHDNAVVTAVVFVQDKPVYLFLLPRPDGDLWNFLVLSLERSIDLEEAMAAVMRQGPCAPWFAGARVVREFAAVEAIRAPVIKPFRNNVLIVGDAGACQELECLGAMLSGWKGGCAIAAALKEQQLGLPPRAIGAYEDWWLNTYIKQYDYQDYLSIFGIAYMFGSPEVIDYLFSLLGAEPFPATFNPYTAVGLLGERLQAIMGRVMQERPEVVQQLAGAMMRFPSEIMARTRQGVSESG